MRLCRRPRPTPTQPGPPTPAPRPTTRPARLSPAAATRLATARTCCDCLQFVGEPVRLGLASSGEEAMWGRLPAAHLLLAPISGTNAQFEGAVRRLGRVRMQRAAVALPHEMIAVPGAPLSAPPAASSLVPDKLLLPRPSAGRHLPRPPAAAMPRMLSLRRRRYSFSRAHAALRTTSPYMATARLRRSWMPWGRIGLTARPLEFWTCSRLQLPVPLDFVK